MITKRKIAKLPTVLVHLTFVDSSDEVNKMNLKAISHFLQQPYAVFKLRIIFASLHPPLL